jgi:hypothetical protein
LGRRKKFDDVATWWHQLMGLLSAEELFVVVDIAVAVVVHLHAVAATAVVHGL